MRATIKENIDEFRDHDEWRDLKEFPDYMINTNGDILSKHTGRLLSPYRSGKGCYMVGLRKNKKQYDRSVRRLLSDTFPPDHSDGWLDIQGFPGYKVSMYGEVYSDYKKELLSTHTNEKGYYYVGLWKSGKTYCKRLNRLVANAFIPNPENYPEVNHLDGDKSNNRADNLVWSTHADNMIHAYENGLRSSPAYRKVRIVETGEIFNSIAACARYLKVEQKSITVCLHNPYRTCRGYHIEDAIS